MICREKTLTDWRRKTILFLTLVLVFVCFPVNAGAFDKENAARPDSAQSEKKISIRVPYRGKVILEGDITAGDEIELHSREYRSFEPEIKDRVIVSMTADTDGSAEIPYNFYAEALSEEKIKSDFSFRGGDVLINALYAVVADGETEVITDLFYTDCFLDSGVVNQYWCTYIGNEACGPAAGAIALQFIDPVYGNDMFNRVNTMRNYCLDGEEYCTGHPFYELVEDQITNTVNRYVEEEKLSDNLLFTDHRTKGKTTEETLIELLTTGRPAVIEVCYLRGGVTEDFWGYSHWITINGFSLEGNGYWFRYSDPITVSYVSVSSDLLDKSNKNVSYKNLSTYGTFHATPSRYIGAFREPLLSISGQ